MKEAKVYWIHLPTHNDIYSEGYIGVSTDIKERLNEHKRTANNGTHINPHLLNAIIKSGNTILQSVVAVGTEDYCYKLELKLRPVPDVGWNIAPGGMKPPGRKTPVVHTEESKQKCREAAIKQWKEGKGKLPPNRKGLPSGFKGKKHTEEWRKKQSERNLGKNNPMYGKHHLPESKERAGVKPIEFIPHNAIKVKYKEIVYNSLADASRKKNISTYYIQKDGEVYY